MESLTISELKHYENGNLSLNVVTYKMRMSDEAEKHLTKIYEEILEMQSNRLTPEMIVVSKPVAEAIAVKNYDRFGTLNLKELFGIKIAINGRDQSIHSYVLSDNETEMFKRR